VTTYSGFKLGLRQRKKIPYYICLCANYDPFIFGLLNNV
jgi:hypothetical protein